MRRSKKPIVIASRQSRLARVQAEKVGAALQKLHPGIAVTHKWIDSDGDQLPDMPLASRGGKGLFTKRIEQVLLNGDADLAVHSLKDMPVEATPGLALAAIGKRTDVRDVLISRAGYTAIAELPSGATVGTSAPRRSAQLLNLRPDLKVVPLRGNVDTRLDKTLAEDSALDATLLAAAGLKRLGLKQHLKHPLTVEELLPAASQGALGIQCRSDDHVSITRCLPLNHASTATAVHAERGIVEAMQGDCHSPVAAFAEPCESPVPVTKNADAHWFRLRVKVLSPDGTQKLERDDRVMTRELRRLVQRFADDLLAEGARAMILGNPLAAEPSAPPA